MWHISDIVTAIPILIFAFQIQYESVIAQNTLQNKLPIEVTKCRDVKESIFKEVKTFSAFVYGAEEVRIEVDNCKQFTPLVIGGSPASPKEFPHMARLGHAKGNSLKWFCGGTLISEKFVLTAAHCFYSTFGDVNMVRLGELDFNSDTDDARPEDFTVRNVIQRTEYNNSAIYNDIGLVELDRNVIYDEYKHPACLPTTDSKEFNNLLAIGWGSVGFQQAESSKLLKVKLNNFDSDSCQRFGTSNSDNLPQGIDIRGQLCAGSEEAKDTCPGDSGGPLLAYHPKYPCMYYVVGITSFGIGCGTPNQPGVYTRVYKYIDWIRSTVWPSFQ